MRIDYYHKERNDNLSHLSVYCSNKNDLAAVEQGEDLAEIQESICHLVNLPSNIKNPRYMVDWARNRFANRNIDITVLDHEDIQRKGMGALFNVGKGSVTPPHVLILEYRPKSTHPPVNLMVNETCLLLKSFISKQINFSLTTFYFKPIEFFQV
jgi:leucyl aminopeptidase